jgi:hypothetical protein
MPTSFNTPPHDDNALRHSAISAPSEPLPDGTHESRQSPVVLPGGASVSRSRFLSEEAYREAVREKELEALCTERTKPTTPAVNIKKLSRTEIEPDSTQVS